MNNSRYIRLFSKASKKVLASLLLLFLIFIGYVVVSVHFWAITDEGRLPPKTAVILYAINNQIITADMNPPKFLTKQKPSTFAKEDFFIATTDGKEIPARVYYPKEKGSYPVVLYYHGGAFLKGFGDIETHDNIVRALATKSKAVVIAVGYRVAPEYVFPTAVLDSYDALGWAYENVEKYHGDRQKIVVAGDSAGGNLATAVALMSRDLHGPKLSAQVLLYPLTTFQDIPLASRSIYDSGYYLLSRGVMMLAREQYTPSEGMWLSPYTSPLNADNLDELPPTLIITAEYDPLKDEGSQYGEKLASFDVPVKHVHYKGVMHGFISFYEVMRIGDHGLQETVSYIKKVFNGDELEDYEKTVISSSNGKEGIREIFEAYAIAAYLIVKAAID